MTVRSAGPVLSRSGAVTLSTTCFLSSFERHGHLPGLSPEALDIDVGRTVLTVKAEHRATVKSDNVQVELSERPLGVFSGQVVLADTEHIGADHDAGVLPLRIPSAERAKPRKISIDGEAARKEIGDRAGSRPHRQRRTGRISLPLDPVPRVPRRGQLQ